ncbi:hypothetical protein GCM10007301_48460 [Azorhizobium oxalatiphilum]|uniref:DUF1211 domain-containing protein n=1 Tax=Azorhizobium oxalatiphilum TaxID=980631 RepID=A0A917CB22_9HYPH|nr:TMEM175 family protein [Azorhizobium oxalatiphilum]GGF82646.1 hypothetical protein GCM10007301_48460 [Azorhizobium oxalatiphilum]
MSRRFARSRLEALNDGIFAFAMTLLVLGIRLPPDLPITDPRELAAQILGLWPQALTYGISFAVLAVMWHSAIEHRQREEAITSGHVRLWMLYLLFITSMPFSSSVVGHYGEMAPAVWLYAANMLMLGLLGLLLNAYNYDRTQTYEMAAARRRMLLFMGSAVLSALIALFAPRYALWAYALNILRLFSAPPPQRRRAGPG